MSLCAHNGGVARATPARATKRTTSFALDKLEFCGIVGGMDEKTAKRIVRDAVESFLNEISQSQSRKTAPVLRISIWHFIALLLFLLMILAIVFLL